jgi:hypothetical protein
MSQSRTGAKQRDSRDGSITHLQILDVEAERAHVPLGDDSRWHLAVHKCYGFLLRVGRNLRKKHEHHTRTQPKT